MSIDITCFSFNEQRADEGWKNFLEDIIVLREVSYESHKLKKKRNEELRKIRDQVDSIYQEKLHQKRLQIFKSFLDKNYFLPGKTSWDYDEPTDHLPPSIREAAIAEYEVGVMDSLLTYATIYPGGVREEGRWIMLDKDTADEYLQIKEGRLEEMERLTQLNPLTATEEKDNPDILTQRQQDLQYNCDLSNLLYEDTTGDDLLYEMTSIDLYYGGVSSEYFEDSSVTDFLFNNLKYSRTVLLSLYEEPLKENIHNLSKNITEEFGWPEDEAITYTIDFLKAMRPVAKDLKENTESVLVVANGGGYDYEPSNSHTLLMRRAKDNLKNFKGALPPVL